MPNNLKTYNFYYKAGMVLALLGMALFTAIPGMQIFEIKERTISADNKYHRDAIWEAAIDIGMEGNTYRSSAAFTRDVKKAIHKARESLEKTAAEKGVPEGVSEWDYKLGNWKEKDYILYTTKYSTKGLVADHPLLLLGICLGTGIMGALLMMVPTFIRPPGIQHNGIYHHPMTRGLKKGLRGTILFGTVIILPIVGYFYTGTAWLWPLASLLLLGLVAFLVLRPELSRDLLPSRSASPSSTAWAGVLMGVWLISFYVYLYWVPHFITGWMIIADPISKGISGNEASQWFLYGLLYTLAVAVMGVRMFAKYRHNRYQKIRTGSVIFFQTAFAFLIPEILVRLNYPYYDFKNIWPLNYSFFFEWNLKQMLDSGTLGLFMLVWGIALIVIAVPVITYFYGKRWYCSWVCGCGALAENMGDPYRQLSDKSLRAWKVERWIVHGVLLFAVIMTAGVLYSWFSGQQNILFTTSSNLRIWYGFLIGAGFAGVIGTGFYPLMGNRMWCRFGCPLAAYLGLVQRFKSRFRITTNGGQCISCGNCSTYCEMGIDVRWYAQRGQDIIRASCVGCGVCAAVCPRGVLRLENGPDINQRGEDLRVIRIEEGGPKIIE